MSTEAAMENIKALREWHLAVRHRRRQKKQTQGNGGPLQKLAITHGLLALHVVPALHKGHYHHAPVRDTVARGVPKEQTLERKRHAPGIQQWNTGLRLKGAGMSDEGGASGRIFMKTAEHEIEK
jgi:hypothetical protein